MTFVLYRVTKSIVDDEREADAMERMESRLIQLESLLAVKVLDVDISPVLAASTWETIEELSDDWSVSAGISILHDWPCIVVDTAETAYIFMPEDSIASLHKKYHRHVDDDNWARCQHFGPNGAVVPR